MVTVVISATIMAHNYYGCHFQSDLHFFKFRSLFAMVNEIAAISLLIIDRSRLCRKSENF